MSEQEKRQHESGVSFGPYRLDVGNAQLRRGVQEVKLTGKAFAVLRYFVEHPGQLATKDDLFAAAWPETVVSEATLVSCIQELRQALRDDAKKPRYIETVHRRGYRFLPSVSTPPVPSSKVQVPRSESRSQGLEVSSQEEVVSIQQEENQKPVLSPSTLLRINSVEGAKDENGLESNVQSLEANGQSLESKVQSLGSEEQRRTVTDQILDSRLSDPRHQTLDAPAPSAQRPWLIRRFVLMGLLLLVGIIAVVQYLSLPTPNPQPLTSSHQRLSLPDKPSIVVLPFTNLSGDSTQDYLSDGITEEIITTLARFPDLFVIARQSAFTYKGKTIKEQEIGKELGVRYVLEGSVRREKDQVRINVQLVDATTGDHVWVEQYERPFAGVLVLQDEIVRKIATTLELQLTFWGAGGSPLRKTTDNLEAWNSVLQGLEFFWSSFTPEGNLRARQFYEKALALDPQYALACAQLGGTYFLEWVFKWNPDPQTLERASEYGQKAVALDNSLPEAHYLVAQVYAQNGQLDRALTEIERAITLAPNYTDSHAVHAEILIYAGRPTEALQSIQQAIRLSPPTPPAYLFTLGWIYHITEHYTESIAALKQVLVWLPLHLAVYPLQAYNYVSLWVMQLSQEPQALDKAYDAAQNAVTLNNAYPEAHMALGVVYLWQKHHDDAITEFERAVALDGNHVCGQMLLAFGLSQVGRVEEAVEVGERALSLKARPSDDRCLSGVASTYALAGRLEEAAALHQRLLKQFPNFLGSHLDLAAIYSELGREAEAQAEALEVMRLNPQFSLEIHKERVPIKDPATLDRHIAALRKAGLK